MRRSQPWRTNRARALRSRATSAEDNLWDELRDRRLDGLKFVRQVAIGPWFADFVCRAQRVIVEIDGATHSTPEEVARDLLRTTDLQDRGYRMFRAHNTDIYENIDGVLDHLLAFIRGEASE